MTRRPLALVLALLVGLGTGCSNRAEALGAGGPMNFCEGFEWYIYFEEPPPDDAEKVDRWAAGTTRIMDRIKPHYKIEMKKGPALILPKTVPEDIKVLKTRMMRLRADVKAAKGDRALVHRAVNELSDDQTLIQADSRLTDFWKTKCEDKTA